MSIFFWKNLQEWNNIRSFAAESSLKPTPGHNGGTVAWASLPLVAEAGWEKRIPTYWNRRLHGASFLTYWNLANFCQLVIEQSNGRCPWVWLIHAPHSSYYSNIAGLGEFLVSPERMGNMRDGCIRKSYRRGRWRCLSWQVRQCESLSTWDGQHGTVSTSSFYVP